MCIYGYESNISISFVAQAMAVNYSEKTQPKSLEV